MQCLTTMMRCRRTTVVAILFVASTIYLIYQISHPPVNDWTTSCTGNDPFVRAVAARASSDRYIILALVDMAFVDMAINLYETSLRPNGIENFLFVGVGQGTCDAILNASLPCFHYTDVEGSNRPSVYLSADFLRKMNVRTDMIIDALAAGFTVVHTDLDVLFFKNPLPELKVIMLDADVAALWDSIAYNAGFIVVRPTWYGRRVYELMRRVTSASSRVDDQRALNYAVRRVEKLYRRPNKPAAGSSWSSDGFRAIALDASRYLCGLDYFEKGNRWFPTNLSVLSGSSSSSSSDDDITDRKLSVGCKSNDGTGCMTVVHNNWIVSREAKVYRFKEHLMWMIDEDGYYSKKTARYLVYDNPFRQRWVEYSPDFEQIFVEQLEALKAALKIGRLLDRIVILPRFHCNSSSPAKSTSSPSKSTGNAPNAAAGKSDRKSIKPGREEEVQPPTKMRHTTKLPAATANFYECPLNSLLNITAFDVEFGRKYRESSFLRHPKVPTSVSRSVSKQFRLAADSVQSSVATAAVDALTSTAMTNALTPTSGSQKGTSAGTSNTNGSGQTRLIGVSSSTASPPGRLRVEPTAWTSEELVQRLGSVQESVLSLGALYDVRVQLSEVDVHVSLEAAFKRSFKRCGYRQLA